MFEGIDLYEIKYSPHSTANSLAGVQIEDAVLSTTEGLSVGQVFLKDCSFLLDGISRVCQFFPISPFAREHFLYIQSFSYWEAGSAYFTQRRGLDSFLLVYTYSGCGQLEYQGNTYLLQEGNVFLIDGREEHLYRTVDPAWKHSVLHFSGTPADFLYKEFSKDGEFCFHLESSIEYQHQLEKLLSAYTSINPYREYQVSALLTSLLLSILTGSEAYQRSQQNMPDQIRDVAYFINSNFAKDISLDQLSSSFSISKYHLCRSFKKYTGFTLNEYITQLRIERAKELLRTTTLPANQIGLLVGIKEENYFYRVFRKHTGLSPHKYRKS